MMQLNILTHAHKLTSTNERWKSTVNCFKCQLDLMFKLGRLKRQLLQPDIIKVKVKSHTCRTCLFTNNISHVIYKHQHVTLDVGWPHDLAIIHRRPEVGIINLNFWFKSKSPEKKRFKSQIKAHFNNIPFCYTKSLSWHHQLVLIG